MSSTVRTPHAVGTETEGAREQAATLDEALRLYARLASAAVIGRRWYLDFDDLAAGHDDLDIARVREVPRWRGSDAFTDLERDVMEYAEAMSTTPAAVTGWMVDKLVDQLGRSAVVELSQVVALENMRSRLSCATDLQGGGAVDAAC